LLGSFNTRLVGKVCIELASTASTNSHAQGLLSKSKPFEGTAIFAYKQQAGRGQYGARWVGEAGKNIAVSVILYPKFLSPHRQFRLNQAVALAVAGFVSEHTSAPVKIKWPNDIYIRERKVSGILIENTISERAIMASVVGVGVNVNQVAFPSALPNPTSLHLVTGQFFDIKMLLGELFQALEQRYFQLKAHRYATLQRDYHQQLYGRNEKRLFRSKEGVFEGTITGTDELGRLLIEQREGVKSYAFKEVEHLPG